MIFKILPVTSGDFSIVLVQGRSVNQALCQAFFFLALTARDASVCGWLDGRGEGGIPDPLPLGRVWRQPRGSGYLQRTHGPEQQV